MAMTAFWIVPALTFALFATSARAVEAAWDAPPCPAMLAPVCAATPCDKDDKDCSLVYATSGQRTFANAQCAAAERAKVISQGECADDPIHSTPPGGWRCPGLFMPVWGSKAGKATNYSNVCEMAKDGAALMGIAGMHAVKP